MDCIRDNAEGLRIRVTLDETHKDFTVKSLGKISIGQEYDVTCSRQDEFNGLCKELKGSSRFSGWVKKWDDDNEITIWWVPKNYCNQVVDVQ
jgi:hypothetical protein